MHRYTPASGALQRTKGRSQGATSTAAPTPLQTVTGCKSMLLTILSHALALRRTVPPTAYAHPHLLRTPLLRQRVAKRMRRRRHAPPKLQVHPATTTRRDCVDCTHIIFQAGRFFAGAPSATEATASVRRGKTNKEAQVDRFNSAFPAPVVKYISETQFLCEYCSELDGKPKMLNLHPRGP